MELPLLGDRCKHPDCQRLDFLPLSCPHCTNVYCGDHFKPERHECKEAGILAESTPLHKYAVKGFVTCTACLERSAVANPCPNCGKHFCIVHRHYGCADPTKEEMDREREKWEAPRRQFEAAKQRADLIVEETLRKAANPTALKVQLMRLKTRATGSKNIPTDERAYFWVEGGEERHALYCSRLAPLGRLLDAAVDKCGASRVGSAPKLRMCSATESLPTGQSVQALIEQGILIEGETLLLC